MPREPIRALLVEDNPGDVRLLRETLREARADEIDLVHVMLLEEALKQVASSRFDVVLLDLSLPDADRSNTVARMVAAAPEAPIVVLTGLKDEDAAFEALRQGAQDYLVKGQSDAALVSRAIRYAIERKRAEIEHQRLEAQLRNAQKLESLGVMAGGIAHDFNNLLTIITCNAHLLQQSMEPNAVQANALRDIETAAAHATEMTRSLLALTRPTRPQIKVLDVNRLSEEIHRFLRRVLPATIDFQLDLEPRPVTLAGDPGQMQQVLINLCLNARDAMPAGGILRIQTRVVGRADLPAHVKPTAEADRFVRVRVSDNGSGMDADTLRQIFDPFFTTKSKDRGTGLGLAIVYKIVEVHKGAIDVASRPDEGTQFDIYFPFVDRVEDPPVETAPAGGQEQVLIVDDEEMIASLMRTLLEARGYRVQVAQRPEQAVALAREPGRKLDLAVVDYQLPDTTGDQCLAELRKTHPGLRAILVTGDTSALPEMNDPRTRVLSKPFTANALTDAVRELLRQGDGVNHART